ncbi:MAG: multicopper oxidase domain-containing protein [Ancrocorticia sp.]
MPRSAWHRMTWMATTFWIVMLIAAVAAQRVLPNPTWYLIHVAGLGIIGTSILVWTWHFADALTRRKQSQKKQLARLVGLFAGTVALAVALATSGRPGLVFGVVGSLLIIGALLWHSFDLARAMKGNFVSPGAVTLEYHLWGGLLLVAGALLGLFMTIDVTDFELATTAWPAIHVRHDGMSLAHVFLMVFGFLGLTILGTLATFGATVARTRLAPGAIGMAMRALPLLVTAIVAGSVASIIGWNQAAGIAAAAWVGIAVVGVLMPMFRTWRGSMIGVGDGWTIGAATIWFQIAGLTWAWQLLSASNVSTARDVSEVSYALLLAAGALQLVLGSLTYLLPVVAGGGPARLRATIEELEPTAGARFFLLNGAMVMAVLPLPELVHRGALLVAGSTAITSFGLLIYAVARQQRREVPGRAGVAGSGNAAPGAAGAGVPGVSLAVGGGGSATSTPGAGTASSGPLALNDPTRAAQLAEATGKPRPMPDARLRMGAVVAAAVLCLVTAVGALPGRGLSGPVTAENVADNPDAPVTSVEVSVSGMSFIPNVIEVPRGNRLVIEFQNTGDQRHDLVIESGVESGPVEPGGSATIEAGVITEDLDVWCSMVGHKQMGMTMTIRATGEATVNADGSGAGSSGGQGHAGHAGGGGSPSGNISDSLVMPTMAELMAEPGEGFQAVDATLQPAPEGTLHQVTMRAQEKDMEIAPGRTQRVWTFNGSIPGPVLRGKVGDTFEITLINEGTMGHSIDFHAGDVAPNQNMRTIEPGESLVYTFKVNRAGIWMYHCSTMPMSLHIANGMYGAVVVDPPDLDPVDREYVVIQSEQYWSADPADGMNPDQLALGIPSAMAFNGYPFQYDHQKLQAHTGERVRFWALDVGPNIPWAFHIVGTQFDTVWREGSYEIRRGCGDATLSREECDPFAPGKDSVGGNGAQVLALAPAEGGFVEFVAHEPGTYTFVNHAMTYAERGAHGAIEITAP